jgi:hypothetical protein
MTVLHSQNTKSVWALVSLGRNGLVTQLFDSKKSAQVTQKFHGGYGQIVEMDVVNAWTTTR